MKKLNETTKPALTSSQKSHLLRLEDKLDNLAKLAGNDEIGRMVYGGIRSEYSNVVKYYQGKKNTPMYDFRGMYRDFERMGVDRKSNTALSKLVYEIGDELSDYIKANIGMNESADLTPTQKKELAKILEIGYELDEQFKLADVHAKLDVLVMDLSQYAQSGRDITGIVADMEKLLARSGVTASSSDKTSKRMIDVLNLSKSIAGIR